MSSLSHHELTLMFFSLALLLATARLLGELSRRFNQPAVMGEILAGIILGPTVFGSLAPNLYQTLFPSEGSLSIVLSALTTLSIVLFLLVAGMEVNLSTVWRQGKTAIVVSITGIIVPFMFGFAAAISIPTMLGYQHQTDVLIFSLFFATALSITALPVIARTLIDLDLFRTDLGMIITAAAVFNDLVGWIIFATILGLIGGSESGSFPISYTIGMVLAFVVFVLTVVRWLINRVLPWVQAHTSWPGGTLGLALSVALLAAAITQWIGIHAIFGSFLVGVAFGDSSHLREHTRRILHDFISFVFAPIFFASIGLQVDFIANFDSLLILMVLIIACLGKIVGCSLGARWAGISNKESWAIGLGMNARGAMEIILGLLALQFKLINEPLFVALVIMALVTSIMSGPTISLALRRKKSRHFSTFMASGSFISQLSASTLHDAITELSKKLSSTTKLDSDLIVQAVEAREQILPTSLGHGLAVPHARLDNLKVPAIAVGISRLGIEGNTPDNIPIKLIFLILTPTHDNGAQIEILSSISRTFRDEHVRQKVFTVSNYTEFLAMIRAN